MRTHLSLLLLVCSSLLLPVIHGALPLCTDSRAPVVLNATLKFCLTDGGSCCDAALKEQFDAMGLKAGGACADLLKPILCSKCNPFSADLFGIGSTARTVPLLCSSSSAPSFSQPEHPKGDYCEQVWKHCKSTAISN